jgi:phosphoribosylformimino-5-aminoimidazole carboxamide ribotide isomerase
MSDLDAADALGVYRFVIGSAAVSDPDFVKAAAEKYGQRIAVGIDAKNGFVRTHGWTENSGVDAIEFAKSMERLGVQTIIFTDIDTDGTLQGPPIEKLKALRDAVSCHIVASGGVTNIGDIRALKSIGMDAAIIGKAYYAGTIDLRQAILEGGE